MPATAWYLPTSQQPIPNSTKATYDGLGRPVKTTTLHHNAEFSSTTGTYSDTDASVTVVPPSGATATKTIGDALGRAVKQITYTNADRSASTYTETTYDPLGNRTQIKDKSGRVWSWTYDSRHRVLTSTDPDAGTSRTWYDDQDHVTQTKDATGKVLHYGYDALGRKLSMTVGSASLPAVEWTYDTAANGIGLPATSVRHTTPGGWTTLYLGETEVMGSQTTTATKAMRSYGQAGAPTVVRYTSSATSAHTLAAQITNTQGTGTVQIKLASGMAVSSRSYDAWGNLRGDLAGAAAWAGSRTYIGGDDESSTGLIHLGARDYDPVTGRFTTLDPVMDFSDLLQLGGYAYADNSPVTKSDPNGEFWGFSQIAHAAWKATKVVAHVAYEYSGVADIVSCATNPSLGSCLMAAATIVITVATFGEGGLALAAARGAMRFGGGVLARGAEQAAVKTAEKTVVNTAAKAVEKKVVKTAEEKAAKAVEKKTAVKATEKSAAKTAEKDAGKASDAVEDAVESSGKCNSFTPDTKVLLANGKTKAIKDLKPGDKVKSTDPVLGGLGTQTVTATIKGHGTKHLVRLTLANGKSITATDGHPIWLPKLHRWAKAKELRSGDWLQTAAGTYVQITAVKAWTQTATVNNLTVSSTHTYYVEAGDTPVLVHNCDDVDEGADLFDTFDVKPGENLNLSEPSASNGRSYITYVAEDSDGNVRYVGRAQGKGNPLQVMKGRIARGHDIFKENPDLTPRVIDVQQSMDANKGAEEFFTQGYAQRGASLLNSPESPALGFSKTARGQKSVQMMDAFFDELLSR
ncbi:polymorphic toxin-type HINT domain-containing protein [Streptomyces sp. NPDC058464]|uniref:polymorphic toxin-type HINT domain-containing protein n=1 Tax=Streptomyces sp. NPDC058464 TaxID=3346511 RepID=UPI003661ED59